MNTLNIFNLLETEWRMNFKNRSELSNKLNFKYKQNFHIFMKRLKENKKNNQFNRICEILEKLGYEIVIKKKNEE